MRQQLPPQWAALAEQKGIRPSFTGIAEAAGIAITTVQRLIIHGRTSTRAVTAVAAALGVTTAKIHQLADLPTGDLGPWDPPKEAHQLNGPERDAIERLIRVMAKGEDSASRQLKAKKSPDEGLRPGIVSDVITSGGKPDATVHQLRPETERRVAKRPSKAEQERRRQRDQDEGTD